jgi:hypothetical protein
MNLPLPPSWASFFQANHWAHFLRLVEDELKKRNLQFEIDGPAGCVRIQNAGAGSAVLGLSNVAQMCHQISWDRWPGAIAHHFGLAMAPPDIEDVARNFDKARPLLKLRLWARESVPDVELVAWDVADDLVAVLTLDLPEMLATVKRADAMKWPLSKAELWHLAQTNVRAEGLLAAPAVDVGDGASVHVLEGNRTFFAASHALFLEAYVGPAPRGAVVAVPRRHTMVFHAIRDLSVVPALNSMMRVIPQMCHEGPGSITSSIYWWQSNAPLTLLPIEYGDGGVTFTPPAPFVDLLNALPRP